MSASESSNDREIFNTSCLSAALTAGGICVLFVCIFCTSNIGRKGPRETYKNPEFSINGARLMQFNYTFNLTLNVTFTNPNKIINFEMRQIQVNASYQGNILGLVTLITRRTTLEQRPNNSSIFKNVVVQGRKDLFYHGNPPAPPHLYNIDVVIPFREIVRLIYGEAKCNLTLAFSSTLNRSTSWDQWDAYNATKCVVPSVNYWSYRGPCLQIPRCREPDNKTLFAVEHEFGG